MTIGNWCQTVSRMVYLATITDDKGKNKSEVKDLIIEELLML